MKNSASVVNLKRTGFEIIHNLLKKYSVFHAVQFYLHTLTEKAIKGIDRPFRGGFESILIRSLLLNWRLGYFLNLILKGLLHKISKKPLDAAY
jgi:hypothetical protein